MDALYNAGYENVAAIYCSGQGGDQGTRAIINNMYGGTFTDAAHTKYTADSAENIKAIQALYDAKGVNFDPSINGGEEITLFRNGTLQGAYLILAARALGLAAGPMGGFDSAKVDAAFFAGTPVRSSFLVNLGYPTDKGLFPRSPRLSFDEAARIV